MSCCPYSIEENTQNCEYEEIEATSEFTYNPERNQTINLCVLDFKSIIAGLPPQIFDVCSLTINVYTSERIKLQSCESAWVKTNILLKPYLPISCSITFRGVINGFSIKSSNQSLLPLNDVNLKVRIQNYNQNSQNIPLGMPVGCIVINSNNFCDM